MTGLKASILHDANEAAKRYAQLIFYHDNQTRPQYGHYPFTAWHVYCQQFVGAPHGVAILSVLSRSYSLEMRRLVEARRKGHTSVKGKSPTPEASGRWNLV